MYIQHSHWQLQRQMLLTNSDENFVRKDSRGRKIGSTVSKKEGVSYGRPRKYKNKAEMDEAYAESRRTYARKQNAKTSARRREISMYVNEFRKLLESEPQMYIDKFKEEKNININIPLPISV